MSEENTQNLPDTRSFEERVFARFDAVDAGLRGLNARVEKLEAESERRAVETKPIWERALAEIAALGQRFDVLERKVDALQEEVTAISRKVDTIERKLDVLGKDVLTVRADQQRLETRMDKLESEHAR